jgi:uncharacterized protein
MISGDILVTTGLTNKQLEIVFQVLATCPLIQRVCVFGSRAQGTAKPNSDLDLAIFGELSDIDIASLRDRFRESELILKVDAIFYPAITNQSLKAHIDLVALEIYSKTPR